MKLPTVQLTACHFTTKSNFQSIQRSQEDIYFSKFNTQPLIFTMVSKPTLAVVGIHKSEVICV